MRSFVIVLLLSVTSVLHGFKPTVTQNPSSSPSTRLDVTAPAFSSATLNVRPRAAALGSSGPAFVHNGLLSPETVSVLERNAVFFSEGTGEAVEKFLYEYHNNGPMSCMTFLSDPELLPALTRAMGDSIRR